MALNIKKIELKWFRGAAESISLDTNSKNVIIFGTNGSGKSCFVDAIEYIISGGKIDHLSHEYSGSRQKDSIINTHIPHDVNASIKLAFTDNNTIIVEIESDGKRTFTSEPEELVKTLQSWKIENYILRQDEVAKFIHLTKGAKYSVLLPLLGLEELEKAADNFKRLNQRIKKDSQVDAVQNRITHLTSSMSKYYTTTKDPRINENISELCSKYDVYRSGDLRTDSHNLMELLNDKIDDLSPSYTRYQLLKQCRDEQLQSKLDAYDTSKSELIDTVGEVIDKKIEILQASSGYLRAIDKEGKIVCPACGQLIDSEEFKAHIESEIAELEDARAKKKQYNKDERMFLVSFNQVIKLLNNEDLKKWMEENGYEEIVKKIGDLETRIKKSEHIHYKIEIDVLCKFIETELRESPEITNLMNDKDLVRLIQTIPGIISLKNYNTRIQSTLDFLQLCENKIQIKIKEKAEKKMDEITKKLQELWLIIHPREPIEDVRLYIPDGVDKAIDISLKFFGVDQPSPRVTLSEGHRNSLGLCIFLALALAHESDDPIILDDIVSSLDREHRNRIIDILKADLTERQVFLFTHDRGWFIELATLLPEREWTRLILKPWNNPQEGIQWARTSFWFDDARALLPDHPGPGVNTARGIMDSYLAIAAENLLLELPFRRGTRNDRRTAVEFLDRLIGDGPSVYKIKKDEKWVPFNDPIEAWREVRGLLVAYGDPGSHGGEVTFEEAEKTIIACEKAWNYFRCEDCNDYVWIADQKSRERKQCSCGKLRWKYG